MKCFLTILFVLAGVAAMSADDTIVLPKRSVERGSSIMQALQNRRSSRSFSEQELSLQDLADLLWAANGLNRPDKHTNASGKNKQSIELYICMKSGAYRYDPKANVLHCITTEDLRPLVADWQDFARKAPVSLVVASNLKDPLYREEEWKSLPAYDAGIVSGNIYLFCSANGMDTICRTTMNRNALKEKLKLTDQHVLHLNHQVGYSADSESADRTSVPFARGERKTGEHFHGEIYISVPAESDRFGLAYLDFQPGSYNDWHVHPGATQVMMILDGGGFYQEAGKPVRLLKKGDIVVTPADVVHWNGASHKKALLHFSVTDQSGRDHIEWKERIDPTFYSKLPGEIIQK